jgi:hypothetical protein
MRFLLTVIVIAVVGYVGYDYYQKNKAEVDARIAAFFNRDSPNEAPQDSYEGPVSAPPPVFQSKIQMPDVPPGEKKIAAPGDFYLLERVTVETPTGVVAVNPGEQVKLLGRKNGKMRVMIGTMDFEVKESQVTNDLEIALEAEKRDFVNRGGKL